MAEFHCESHPHQGLQYLPGEGGVPAACECEQPLQLPGGLVQPPHAGAMRAQGEADQVRQVMLPGRQLTTVFISVNI